MALAGEDGTRNGFLLEERDAGGVGWVLLVNTKKTDEGILLIFMASLFFVCCSGSLLAGRKRE